MNTYYKNEFKKLNLKTEYPLTFKLRDSDGNQTNTIDINLESIESLETFLKKIKEQLKK